MTNQSGNPIHYTPNSGLADQLRQEEQRKADNQRRWDDEQRRLNNSRPR